MNVTSKADRLARYANVGCNKMHMKLKKKKKKTIVRNGVTPMSTTKA